MPTRIDLAGARFGRLTALEPAESRSWGSRWRCRCDCGIEVVSSTGNLRRGRAQSCGCLMREVVASLAYRHGGAGTAVYQVWSAMRSRCENPKAKGFENYGGRGIRVCDRWASFEAFLADMGERPPGGTLERRMNDGHYEPGNCFWAPWSVQARNKRTTRFIQFDGETLPLQDWAIRFNTTGSVLSRRLEKFGTLHPIRTPRRK